LGTVVAKADKRQIIAEIVAVVNPRDLTARVLPTIAATVSTFGDKIAEEFGTSFDVADPQVSTFLRTYGADRITGKVNKTTRRQLKKVLADGVAEGKGGRAIRKDIQRVFTNADARRARMIAETEVGRASNFGTLESMKQAGVPEKEWLTTLDGHERYTHGKLAGQIRKTKAKFDSPSGARAHYPGGFGVAAEDINCRCGVVPAIASRAAEGVVTRRHRVAFKVLERQRAPFDRAYRRQIKAGFKAQKGAVLDAFDRLWPPDEPAS
jgi:SPP1 gp7 family putative phage head morphogenesis protein